MMVSIVPSQRTSAVFTNSGCASFSLGCGPCAVLGILISLI